MQHNHTLVSALNDLDDKRIAHIRPLIPPQILMEDLPLSISAAETILEGRKDAEAIIHGKDDRLLVVVGPCSIHDVGAANEYGKYITKVSKRFMYSFFSLPQLIS
jgi:3-deoxy-7-phosphoheptulonate synthase